MTGIAKWSWFRLATVSLIFWALAAGYVAAFYNVPSSNGVAAAITVVAPFLALAYAPTVFTFMWARNNQSLAVWHPGKLAMVWAALLVPVVYSRHDLGGGAFFLIVLGAVIAPALALTWSWLSGRE
jgi:hypothetical protein